MSKSKRIDSQSPVPSQGLEVTAHGKKRVAPGQSAAQFIEDEAQKMERLDRKQGLSLLENVLQKFFKGKSRVGANQPGRQATFAGKSAALWAAFFANLTQHGSREQSFSRRLKEIKQAFFRGLAPGVGKDAVPVLIADFHREEGGRRRRDKFVRTPLPHKNLVGAIQALHPGDPLAAEVLQRFGEMITYTRPVHVSGRLSDAEKKKRGLQVLEKLRSRFPWSNGG